MSFSKLHWQYRGLGLPPGVALTRPVSRNPVAKERNVLLVGDGFAVALAPLLKRTLIESGATLDGPIAKSTNGVQATHVIFAFDERPKGAPELGWQMPIASRHRTNGVRLLWLDVAPAHLVDSSSLKQEARRVGVDLVRPSEQVLRRAANGMISAVGMAGLAGLVGAWLKVPPLRKLK